MGQALNHEGFAVRGGGLSIASSVAFNALTTGLGNSLAITCASGFSFGFLAIIGS
jgi:hypothetical protein